MQNGFLAMSFWVRCLQMFWWRFLVILLSTHRSSNWKNLLSFPSELGHAVSCNVYTGRMSNDDAGV